MKNSCLAAGILAATISLGCVVTSQAQVTGTDQSTQSQQTTTTTYPSTSMSMPAPMAATPEAGQAQTVTYDRKFLGISMGKTISKAVTIEPGAGMISLDGLGRRDTVNLTLINPSATPLQFETIGRRGQQVVTVVPPHSQQVLTTSRLRNDVGFFVMQLPSDAIATNQDYVTQQTAAVATVQQAYTREDLDRQTAQIRSNQEEALREAMVRQAIIDRAAEVRSERRTEQRSAVRGYW